MTRNLSLCDVCGQLDDHPRHRQQAVGHPDAVPTAEFLAAVDALPERVPASAMAELMHPHALVRHMHCCAARGCEVCKATEATHEGLRGADLVAHLESGAVDHLGYTPVPSTPAEV